MFFLLSQLRLYHSYGIVVPFCLSSRTGSAFYCMSTPTKSTKRLPLGLVIDKEIWFKTNLSFDKGIKCAYL